MFFNNYILVFSTRRRMARERKGAGSSLVSMETPYYKTIYYIKMCSGRREEEYQDNIAQVQDNSLHRKHFYKQKLLHTDAFTHKSYFTHRSFYTQHFYTDTFTHRSFYTQALLQSFTHRHFYTQALLHTDSFTHRRFTHSCIYTDAFTHKSFYPQKLLQTEAFTHRRFYTQTLLHTDAFTHRSFYTQTLLHTEAFTHRHFYTQTLLHAGAFTHRSFYTQRLLHKESDAFTHRPFYTLRRTTWKSQFHRSFWRSNLVSCERVARDDLDIAISPQFLAIEPHFVRKGCAGRLGHRNFTAIFGDRTSFRAKGLRGTTWTSQFYISFWRSNLISCERVARDDLDIAILHQFLALEPHFVRKGCAGRLGHRNFTAVFGDRTSLRAKGLRFVSSRWHCPCPCLQERNRKEGKRARGQEGKRRRCEDEKM